MTEIYEKNINHKFNSLEYNNLYYEEHKNVGLDYLSHGFGNKIMRKWFLNLCL